MLCCIATSGCKEQRRSDHEVLEEVIVEKKLEAVAALGKLIPMGDVRRLDAPVIAMGGTPRISKILVLEGQSVKVGQILAVFDNRPNVLADLLKVNSRIKILEKKITLKRSEVSRYLAIVSQGATSMVALEDKQHELLKLEGELEENLAIRLGLEADLVNTELDSPIDGIVLRINSRVGERPGNDGVMEVGANNSMEALIEVYESDINRIFVGQLVSLVSEKGGFDGTLDGVVELISPQVRQRNVLSTDPTGDADARVIEVRVSLNSSSSLQVRRLTGMKVIAKFKPL